MISAIGKPLILGKRPKARLCWRSGSTHRIPAGPAFQAADQILPIDQCSRAIVPRLRAMGYDVTFREFDGRHEMPPAVVREGLQWITAR